MYHYNSKNGIQIRQLISGRSNIFIIRSGNHSMMIDSGRKSPGGKLISLIRQVLPHGPEYLVLTHSHFDHAGNAKLIHDTFGSRILIHTTESRFLESGDSPLPQGTFFPLSYIMKHYAWRSQPHFAYSGCTAWRCTENDENLSSIGFDVTLLHTPGHTAGSISLVIGGEVAIVGDAMMGVAPHTVFPPFADDVPEMLKSWKKLLDTHCHTFLPGHGKAVSRDKLMKCYLKKSGNPK